MPRRTNVEIEQRISEMAAEWFVEFRSGDVDAEGRRAFKEWIRRSPEHLQAYLEHAAIWNEGTALDAKHATDMAGLLEKIKLETNVTRMEARPAQEGTSSDGKRLFGKWAVAASLMLAAAAGIWAYSVIAHGGMYSTDVGEQRSIRLPDGSMVELNSRSRLHVRFENGRGRWVDLLEGQALFRVAKDPERPFVVHSGDTHIRAVGTQFDVNRRKAATVVTVVEGRVAVSKGGAAASVVATNEDAPLQRQPVLLSAGEQLKVMGRVVMPPVSADPEAATAWTHRRLVLQSMALHEVAEEFNRYSTRKLTAQDTASEQLKLSGVFSTDPDFLLRYLRARSDVEVIETDDEIRILHRD